VKFQPPQQAYSLDFDIFPEVDQHPVVQNNQPPLQGPSTNGQPLQIDSHIYQFIVSSPILIFVNSPGTLSTMDH
jgi:hypothetical protein